MIIVLKSGSTQSDIDYIKGKLHGKGLKVHVSQGEERTIIGAIGDERILREAALAAYPAVEAVLPILKPFKLASRDFHKEDTRVTVGDAIIGSDDVIVIAGPCSVETREGLLEVARSVKKSGAKLLRGGAFKPRSSPYAFQGLGEEGLKYLAEARDETGLKIVTELMDPRDAELVDKYADMIQIGARNMSNFNLLKEVGKMKKPVLLKRGLSSTVKEWLMSAEYILNEGNMEVILCERGVRTFETETRNTLDLSCVPLVQSMSHLPIIVDPSHAVGRADLVTPMSMAAVAAGTDGLLIEVHENPEEARCDGPQSLRLDDFASLMKSLRSLAKALGREL
ncbi:MAG: 3-deoxy-7-phosphoheptulonate synthase [bacterium]|nr:3-deoxy-7-phosphoheptulonate synthase [bacterium]MDT8366008.1 3-deoxy-7-phosphoheptulonate synthase [bacterium]